MSGPFVFEGKLSLRALPGREPEPWRHPKVRASWWCRQTEPAWLGPGLPVLVRAQPEQVPAPRSTVPEPVQPAWAQVRCWLGARRPGALPRAAARRRSRPPQRATR